MTLSVRETVIQALITALETTGAVVMRGGDLPETIPPEGLITVAEAEAQTDVSMSPLTYHVDQAMTVDVAVVGVDELDRNAKADVLVKAVTAACVAMRDDDNDVEWVEIDPATTNYLEANGPAVAHTLTVTLSFSAPDAPTT